jgi:hypothetical protein
MSNHLAVATVTATLQKMLQDTVQADVEGARVTTVRPDNLGRGTPETGVNVYLYRVNPVNWRNADLPSRRSTGDIIKRPQIALDLHYIFTFYGNEVELEPQRLLGSVIRSLHTQPILGREVIQDTIDTTPLRYLRESDLDLQVEMVKFMLLPLSTEELSKIWSVFFQTPYTLSVAYHATTVLIESEEIPKRALPVRETRVTVIPTRPIINQIISLDKRTKTWSMTSERLILADSPLKIRGTSLRGEITRVKIGETEIPVEEGKNTEISVNLGLFPQNALRAGVQGLQIIHRKASDPHWEVDSNVFPFILLPTLKELEVAEVEEEGSLRSAKVNLLTHPIVGQKQRVFLSLNQIGAAESAQHSFPVSSREEDSDRLTVQIKSVQAGEYLVRLQVDGAESLLEIDHSSESTTSGQFIAPKITIP